MYNKHHTPGGKTVQGTSAHCRIQPSALLPAGPAADRSAGSERMHHRFSRKRASSVPRLPVPSRCSAGSGYGQCRPPAGMVCFYIYTHIAPQLHPPFLPLHRRSQDSAGRPDLNNGSETLHPVLLLSHSRQSHRQSARNPASHPRLPIKRLWKPA